MFMRLAVPVLALGLSVQPVLAQTAPADVAALYDALQLDAMLAIMREEGLSYGETIETDLFQGAAPAAWIDEVGAIYDVEKMQTQVQAVLATALEGQDLTPMLAFFQSETGQALVTLEVSARSALLDDDVEAASKDSAAIALTDGGPRVDQVRRFVEANDLVETNVMGAMNSNYAFYLGLMDGGGLPDGITQDQILTDVWSQEAEIRATTTEWVYSFLLLAYQPVSDADLDAYIAFSETEPGRALNTAMFTAFDAMFVDISRALGQASARYMTGQEL